MHDIRAIREKPDFYNKNWARRGLDPQTDAILKLDEEHRAVQTELQSLQQERNEKSKKIGEIKREGGDAEEIMQEVAGLKNTIFKLEERERTLDESLNQHLAGLPNLLSDDVPDGETEEDNSLVRTYGEPRESDGQAPDHVHIGQALGMMDFETAAEMSGSRFVILKDGLARLERALAQFMIDTHVHEHGYTEVSPPLLVRDEALFGTGQLPKFAEDQFRTTTDHWLVPTAEVSLTNMVHGQIMDAKDLPLRYTAYTPCFRSEAGAAGKDTRGMIRQHQFYKVEMVSIVHPDHSWDELERMTQCAETILKKLDLPYRTVVLCSGDTGFGARKTYDIEVWMPGQERYREISSCSNCCDFQARRMMARFKDPGEKQTQYLHTLNGSGLAVGRALIAVLENYYDPADEGVFVPAALQDYMGGLTKLLPAEPGA